MPKYIDFEIAREYLHKACEGLGSNGGLMLKIKFDEEPTADVVERQRGKWIVDDEYIDCSCCRHEKWSRMPYEQLVSKFRFCPNCGADMRGGIDDN